MRNLHELDRYRRVDRDVIRFYGWVGDEACGVFEVPSVTDRKPMMVIASSGEGWEHVSVSRKNRCPNWPEMDQIKRMFFRDDETVMQLHVPVADHISVHDNCLHLWRPVDGAIPRPPGWAVGTSKADAAVDLGKAGIVTDGGRS